MLIKQVILCYLCINKVDVNVIKHVYNDSYANVVWFSTLYDWLYKIWGEIRWQIYTLSNHNTRNLFWGLLTFCDNWTYVLHWNVIQRQRKLKIVCPHPYSINATPQHNNHFSVYHSPVHSFIKHTHDIQHGLPQPANSQQPACSKRGVKLPSPGHRLPETGTQQYIMGPQLLSAQLKRIHGNLF